MERLTNAERTAAFGPWGQVRRELVTTPWGVRCQVHHLLVEHFLDTCHMALAVAGPVWKPKRIDSYNARPERDAAGRPIPGTLSIHGWALAWDFYATPPGVDPPGGAHQPTDAMPEVFGRAFELAGFTWGKRFKTTDVPHIEWAGPPPPATPIAKDPIVLPTFSPPIHVADMCEWPGKGVVAVAPDGAVYCSPANLYRGGANVGAADFPGTGRTAARVAYRPANGPGSHPGYGEGYTITATTGETYNYDGGPNQ